MTSTTYLKLMDGDVAIVDYDDLRKILTKCLHWYAKPVAMDHHHHIPVCTDKDHNHVYVVANNEEGTHLHELITGFENVLFVDYNGLNNQRSNLEPSGGTQLAISSPKKRFKKPPTSKYKGVYWNKNMAKWKSQIYRNNKQIHIGYYTSEVEAAKAYDTAAKKLFGEYAYLNFQIEKDQN